MGSWTQTSWGPVLEGVSAWAGVRLREPGRSVGWSLLLDGEVEHVEIVSGDPGDPGHPGDPGDTDEPLVTRRGRYLRPDR